MRRLALLLVACVWVAAPSCGRTDLDTMVPGAGGTMLLGGMTGTGGAFSAGGIVATGGLVSASGGAVGNGDTHASGGIVGAGGSVSGVGGSLSTSDLDSCSSDAGCLSSCIWITAPTSSSQCTANYCCGMTWLSQKRCDANRAAWASYCPSQSPTSFLCPCYETCKNEVFGCFGGRCTTPCPPAGSAGGSTAFPHASGGNSGNDGDGGIGATVGSSSSGGARDTGGGTVVLPPASDASVTAISGPFTSVSVGSDCACGVRVDKTIACWVVGGYGTCEPPSGTFSAISLGFSASCGVETLGTISCWNDVTDQNGLVEPPTGTFTSVSTGDSVLCGIRTDGTVACSGSFVTVGDSTPPSDTFTAVSVGTLVVCGVRTDGTLACWGHTSDVSRLRRAPSPLSHSACKGDLRVG